MLITHYSPFSPCWKCLQLEMGKKKKCPKVHWCVLPPSSSSTPSVSIYTGVGGALETASNTNYGVYSGPAPLHIISRYILPQRGISGTYRHASDVWWCYTLLSEGSIKTPEIGILYMLQTLCIVAKIPKKSTVSKDLKTTCLNAHLE